MKFYLSSFKIGKNPKKLKQLCSKNCNAIYIANGLDFAKKGQQKDHIDWDLRELNEIGIKPIFLDLRDYFWKKIELKNKLKDIDLIYISGGNVYDLRIAMKLSGLDDFILENLSKDIVYAGYSAAVCILSPTLKWYHIVDNPYLKTYNDGKTIWEGLNIINWQFAPHFNSNHSESEGINKEIDYYITNNMKYRTLTDGEVIII